MSTNPTSLPFHDWTHLEHLNEGNTQIQVSHIAADQAQTEEETDGDDSAQVDTAGHLHGFPAIEKGGGPGEELGHERREGQVPGGQDNG